MGESFPFVDLCDDASELVGMLSCALSSVCTHWLPLQGSTQQAEVSPPHTQAPPSPAVMYFHPICTLNKLPLFKREGIWFVDDESKWQCSVAQEVLAPTGRLKKHWLP